jgi:hypothetical protein
MGIHRRVKETNSGNASELQVIFWRYNRIQTHPVIHRGNSENISEYKIDIFKNTSDRWRNIWKYIRQVMEIHQ